MVSGGTYPQRRWTEQEVQLLIDVYNSQEEWTHQTLFEEFNEALKENNLPQRTKASVDAKVVNLMSQQIIDPNKFDQERRQRILGRMWTQRRPQPQRPRDVVFVEIRPMFAERIRDQQVRIRIQAVSLNRSGINI